MRTNDIALYPTIDGLTESHFTLREFQNRAGWAMVHPSMINSVHQTRAGLNAISRDGEVELLITDCVRTPQQLIALAAKYGWTDEGGIVARRSFHLFEFGGIAADFKARYKKTCIYLPARQVYNVAQLYFDYAKYYDDGHVHGDNRKQVTG